MKFEWGTAPSIDMHLKAKDFESVRRVARAEPTVTSMRVASLGDLTGFLRVAEDVLVHKSTRDLWQVTKTADGAYDVTRLFADDGQPIKG
jgi:hypothetical protein